MRSPMNYNVIFARVLKRLMSAEITTYLFHGFVRYNSVNLNIINTKINKYTNGYCRYEYARTHI